MRLCEPSNPRTLESSNPRTLDNEKYEKNSSSSAAKELYGENSAEYNTVAAAWDAVGVVNQSEPTALGAISEQPSVRKLLRNGRVLIVRDGRTYDALGRLLP